MILQIMNILGAACILGAFMGLQYKKLRRESPWFNLVNALGSILLGSVAVVDHRYGWIVMEAVWTWISIRTLLKTRNGSGELWDIHSTTQP